MTKESPVKKLNSLLKGSFNSNSPKGRGPNKEKKQKKKDPTEIKSLLQILEILIMIVELRIRKIKYYYG